jgi:hypothetical protein
MSQYTYVEFFGKNCENKVKQYFERYQPEGYDTKVIIDRRPSYAKIRRLRHCE